MVARIIIIKDDKPIDQIELTAVTSIIGRKSVCDISIKDPAVSGTHATIQKLGGNYVIQDAGSTNGLHIKGKRVNQQVLRNNDVITVGEHQLKFVISESGERGAASRSAKSRPAGRSGRASAGSDKRVLKVLNGDNKGHRIKLEDGLTTIGEPGVQVAAVSKRPQGHFIIHVDGGKDRDKVPLVNGEPIGFKSRKLETGDEIEVAGILMEYCSD